MRYPTHTPHGTHCTARQAPPSRRRPPPLPSLPSRPPLVQGANPFKQTGLYYELFPGSPAVCGHGNREFSFIAKRSYQTDTVVVAFLAGGMCWDEDSCGLDPARRAMGADGSARETSSAVSPLLKIALQSTSTSLNAVFL